MTNPPSDTPAVELKACPFCGHTDIKVMIGISGARGYSMLCGGCGIRQGSAGRTEAGAIAAWNARPAQAEPALADAMSAALATLDEVRRQYLEDILAGGEQARSNLYLLFDAGRQVRAVADKMYWAVREDRPADFESAMAEYEQVVGLCFTTPDVQLEPFAALTPDATKDAEIERLRSALTRLSRNFDLMLAGKPVRDVAETKAECRTALQGTDQ